MIEELESKLAKDTNGLLTYEYIANHINSIDDMMPDLVENMIRVDKTGQFVVSTARYLHAIDPNKFSQSIDTLIKAAIEKDRNRAYLADLVASIWGKDYQEWAAELNATDDKVRRIYKRL